MQLDLDELDSVTGGKGCYCAVGGGGTGDGKRIETCACVIGGGGFIEDSSGRSELRCGCPAIGGGD